MGNNTNNIPVKEIKFQKTVIRQITVRYEPPLGKDVAYLKSLLEAGMITDELEKEIMKLHFENYDDYKLNFKEKNVTKRYNEREKLRQILLKLQEKVKKLRLNTNN